MDAEKCENAKLLLSHALQMIRAISDKLPPECADPVLARIEKQIAEERTKWIIANPCDCELRFMHRD